ncbi:hemolysin family protein [Alkalimonas collagenimarina]|uniref:Polyamine export protein n=1 Tax=Alkalimonas collagenimarina TaxID=400390 RepID=A0ABT9GWJ1_9GAMM|nr:hemolysin family protein [Alkalimonas collagenimarina]MDP4535430.1 hemolysin family protein [Alkalimonas collagenimarina]
MTTLELMLLMLLLVATSSFFSMSEIALAASRKMRLRLMASDGDVRAEKVLLLQEQPGNFFTVVQIGLNAVAILGGILGEAAFTPHFINLLSHFTDASWVPVVSFALSVFVITALFILFADLMPKRLAMIAPEKIAVRVVHSMLWLILLLKPLVWLFNGLANFIFSVFRVPTLRKDDITPEDIIAMMDAGAQAGVLQVQEHQLLENVFDMESRTVTSAMTARESLIFFTHDESQAGIKAKIAEHPHSKFIVCDQVLDRVVGYVDSRDILMQVLHEQPISLSKEGIVRTPLIIPDTLSLYEVLEQFKSSGLDFAIIMNEYALVVGIITLKDVMSIVMGELVHSDEEQIIKRDQDSWLVEGLTPLADVMRVLAIDSFPHPQNYETIAGFMMYTLKKIPKRTDFVLHAGYKFEVVDIDSYKIDQLLVTRIGTIEQPFDSKSNPTEP